MAKKKTSKLSNLFNTGPKKLLVFLIAFVVIGGGVMAYRSFANTKNSDAEINPEKGSTRARLTKEEARAEVEIANAKAIESSEKDTGCTVCQARNKLIRKATAEEGIDEQHDKSRINQYTKAGGCSNGSPWCAGFVSWVYQTVDKINDPPKTCAVSTLLSDKDTKKIQDKNDPKQGDILIAKHGEVSHTAIFSRVAGDDFISIDGNWGDEVSVHRDKWSAYWDSYLPVQSFKISD